MSVIIIIIKFKNNLFIGKEIRIIDYSKHNINLMNLLSRHYLMTEIL